MGSIRSLPSMSSIRNSTAHAGDILRERAHSAADAGADLGATARERFTDLLDDLQHMFARAQKVSGRELSSLRKQMSKKLAVASDTLECLGEDASKVARRTVKQTGKVVRSRPLQTVGLVAVAGVLVGMLLAQRAGAERNERLA